MALIERLGPPLEPALGPAKPDPGAGVSGKRNRKSDISDLRPVLCGSWASPTSGAIHVFELGKAAKTWMPGIKPGMTVERQRKSWMSA